MISSRVPASTYRIQFNLGFRFVDARDLIPYLQELGITDLYASPRFRARRGSSHGYDVADPLRVNSELGTDLEFEELVERLKLYRMGLLLDIVPNHMAASSDNPWWLDVLENGPSSRYASFFDIDWHPAVTKAAFLQENRILVPILGDLYGNVLENQDLILKVDEGGFFIRYFDNRLPLDPKTYRPILEFALKSLAKAAGNNNSVGQEFAKLIETVDALPDRNSRDPREIEKRQRDIGQIKTDLWRCYQEKPEFKSSVDLALSIFNGTKADAASFRSLDHLLSRQAYRLGFWKLAAEQINYRRFFDVIELVGLRVEDPRVFQARHAQIFQLIKEDKVTGLRVDHIDGLRDPLGYLQRLHTGAHPDSNNKTGKRNLFVIVEKILSPGEPLREEWPVCGTTGYDFLNMVNGLFIDPAGLAALHRISGQFTGSTESFAEVSYKARKQVLRELFGGEMTYLANALGRLAAHDQRARDVPSAEYRQAIIELTACLPVYRTYIREFQVAAADQQLIEQALRAAAERTSPDVAGPPTFAFLRSVLLLEERGIEESPKEGRLDFVKRWQQFTGAVMAKGVEDTAFYRSFVLISLNEVGGDPGHSVTSVDEFHRAMQYRQEYIPCTLNATSTHDTKRSEDVRARIDVLSELPGRWKTALRTWHQWACSGQETVKGATGIDHRDAILFYQTLVGALPFREEEMPAFQGRIKEYMLKAVREAKVHTSWLNPNPDYERAVANYVEFVLRPSEENAIVKDLRRFHSTVAPCGALNSLSQLLLKITSPGVPDFYQGTELWDFSLVDPDNRRPVDFKLRLELLEDLRRKATTNRKELIPELLANWQDGRIKLFVSDRALDFRRANPELFSEGEYLPLALRGARANHACAFARRLGPRWALVVVPRLVAKFSSVGSFPVGKDAWQRTVLVLPKGAPRNWVDVFAEDTRTAASRRKARVLPLQNVFRTFPLALLTVPQNHSRVH